MSSQPKTLNQQKEANLPVSWLILFILIGFALRLYRLDAQSLWWDEGISLYLATSSWAEIIANRVVNIHPPGYFFILKAWVSLVGVSPFAARYLSVLAGVMQITAVYLAARRWLAPKAVWVAVFLITFSPLSVVYAQETRVYAMLPLIYLGILYVTARFLTASPGRWRRWLWPLAFLEWAGLHLHYITVFVIFFAGVWVLAVLAKGRRWAQLGAWFKVQVVAGAASLPWFGAVLWHLQAFGEEATTGTFVTDPTPLGFLLGQIWTFHFTGLAGVMGMPLFRWLAWGTAVLFGVALLFQLTQKNSKKGLFWLLLWLLPLTSALIVWSVRSFAHPRYVSMYAIGLILVLAWLIAPQPVKNRVGNVAGGLLGVAVMAFFAAGLVTYFTHPAVQKDDVRGAARFLAAQARPDDVIFIPNTDWSLLFEYDGLAPVVMPDTDHYEVMWGQLAEATRAGQRAFQMDYPRGTLDFQQVVAFAMEAAGRLMAVTSFDGPEVRQYELARPLTPPSFSPFTANYGPVQLTGVWLEQGAEADAAAAIALQWQVNQPIPDEWTVSLRLEGDGVAGIAQDFALLDERGRPTQFWQPGQVVTTYHILPLSPGTPPVVLTAVAHVYKVLPDGIQTVDAQTAEFPYPQPALSLGEVALAPPISGQSPYGLVPDVPLLDEPVQLDDLSLIGFGLDSGVYAPGQPVYVRLLWQGGAAALADLRPSLRVVQNGRVLVADDRAPVAGRYPTTLWQPNQLVAEVRVLTIPPGSDGTAEIAVVWNGVAISLQQIVIEGETAIFTPPQPQTAVSVQFGSVAKLVGFDLPNREVAVGDVVPLTLYWQADAPDTAVSYTVFAQLLDENGVLIAQHDSLPANGRRPTTGWVTGEYVTDSHALVFKEGVAYTGPAVVVVGLYDPQTGARLLADTGQDYFVLPVGVEIGD
ncbi:MAG: hypothetical protein Kow0080_28360 [Candidatus Promineifilaceae bacterium]